MYLTPLIVTKHVKHQLCFAAAVRRNRLVSRATHSEVENVIKLWLRYAADHSVGRHACNRRSAASTRHELPYSDASEWCAGVQSAATSVVSIAMKLCGVAVIAVFSHDLRVYLFFIVECSVVSSVKDDDKLISWLMSYPFLLLQW